MLFKQDTDLQEYAAIEQQTFVAVKATIDSVEKKHLLPLLGAAQYKALNDAYNSEDPLPVDLKELLHLSRKVIGPWVCVYYTPKSDVSLGEAGARRMETTTHKTAFQYQVKSFVEANKNEALDAEEILLNFLETNATDYTLWADSDERKVFKKFFIKTAAEFNTLFTTPAPQTNFIALKAKMQDVETLTIKKALGEELFASLKILVSPSPVQADLLFAIKKAIASFSIAEALPFMALRLDGSGLTGGGGGFGNNDSLTSRTPTSESNAAWYRDMAADSGRRWLSQVNKIIKDNPDTFPQSDKPTFPPPKSLFGLK